MTETGKAELRQDSGMDTKMPSRASRVLGGLYRRKWWISAILCAVLVLDLNDGRSGPLAWLLVSLFVLLLWLPILVLGARSVREAGRSFRDGYERD
ncbi:hypothetical protein [Nocardioides sp. Root151]|uniref:hypothetical protein n=1 Tax=Nocardioides sp. Root151 TaxID=1736475 RepID=UPI000702554C|nr:hypothetical protein [Nocardioides sp. Root151]KQZ75547.1 hypothetical protein ASD66_04155 [Nocardioides sp. Root151]